MKLIRISALALVAISAIAIAQAPPVAHTHGRGLANNADNIKGEFGFEANKFVNGENTVVRGSANFATGNPTTRVRVNIETRALRQLTVNGAVAEFGGPGVMRRVTSTGTVRVEGMVRIRVEDLHRADGDPKDKFHIAFLRPVVGGDPTVAFQYGGVVDRGDIVVRSAP